MTKRIRIALLLVLLLAGTTSLLANPDYEVYVTYYTDATYTTMCGYKWALCWGIVHNGCVTPYWTEEYGPACYP